jgi:hypothetical protein
VLGSNQRRLSRRFYRPLRLRRKVTSDLRWSLAGGAGEGFCPTYVPRTRYPGVQSHDGLDEAVAFELTEQVLDILRRAGPRVGDPWTHAATGPSIEADLVQHEAAWRFGFHMPPPEVCGWEVLQVAGDDDLCTRYRSRRRARDGRLDREVSTDDQLLISVDKAILGRRIDDDAETVEFALRYIWPGSGKRAEHLTSSRIRRCAHTMRNGISPSPAQRDQVRARAERQRRDRTYEPR